MLGVFKGWFGEKLTTFSLWLHLDENVYHRIDDIIVPSRSGTTQIDHVLLSAYGIFVIETKNMQGWIFGGENDATWCQSIYGHKTRFQNPLRQNYRHVQCLGEFLKVDRKYLKSVVFFIGECEFKTPMPPNVLRSGLSRYVETFTTPILEPSEILKIERRLRDLKTRSGLTRSDHLESLDRRHSSTTTCPKCGGTLVLCTGRRSGRAFLGCPNYPRCSHSASLKKPQPG